MNPKPHDSIVTAQTTNHPGPPYPTITSDHSAITTTGKSKQTKDFHTRKKKTTFLERFSQLLVHNWVVLVCYCYFTCFYFLFVVIALFLFTDVNGDEKCFLFPNYLAPYLFCFIFSLFFFSLVSPPSKNNKKAPHTAPKADTTTLFEFSTGSLFNSPLTQFFFSPLSGILIFFERIFLSVT